MSDGTRLHPARDVPEPEMHCADAAEKSRRKMISFLLLFCFFVVLRAGVQIAERDAECLCQQIRGRQHTIAARFDILYGAAVQTCFFGELWNG